MRAKNPHTAAAKAGRHRPTNGESNTDPIFAAIDKKKTIMSKTTRRGAIGARMADALDLLNSHLPKAKGIVHMTMLAAQGVNHGTGSELTAIHVQMAMDAVIEHLSAVFEAADTLNDLHEAEPERPTAG